MRSQFLLVNGVQITCRNDTSVSTLSPYLMTVPFSCMITVPPSGKRSCRQWHLLRQLPDLPDILQIPGDPFCLRSSGLWWKLHVHRQPECPCVRPDTGRRSGRYDAASLDEVLQQTVFHSLQVDCLCCRNDNGTDVLCHLFAADNGSSFFDVLVETVGAGADDNLIDLHLAHFVNGAGVARQVRECHGGLDLGQVDFDNFIVNRIFVSLIDNRLAVAVLCTNASV